MGVQWSKLPVGHWLAAAGGEPPGSGTAILSTEGQQGWTSGQPPQLAWVAAHWGLYDPALG